MDEMIKIWLTELHEDEIEEVGKSVSNERIWEKGYDGEEPNPHTENIERLQEYLDVLKEKIEELNSL